MATIIGTTSTYWTFKLEVSEGTPSVETNTSPVTVKAYIGRSASAGGSYMYGAKISCTVGVTGCANQTISYNNSGTVNIAAGDWLHIGTTTFSAVPHNDDGSKVVTVSASFTNNISPASGSASGSFTLTTIARASQPSCITYPEHTQNVGEFGDVISIHMNRKSSDFIHEVRYAFGNLSGVCINEETGSPAYEAENGIRWKIPLSFMDLLPETTSGSGTIYVDTYSNITGDLIGTKYCGFTATVPASVIPTVAMTLEDVTGIDDIYGSPVKGLSKIKVTVNARPAYSSPIASYEISIDGVKYSTKEATTDFLRTAGASPVTVYATDKRRRRSSAHYSMSVQDYSPPAITNIVVTRCNADGSANKRGGYIKATFSAVVSSMNGKNTAAYYLEYKKTTEPESAFSRVNFNDLANNYAPANKTHIFQASAGSSYDVVVYAVDRHNESNPSTKSAKAPTAHSIFSWRGFKNSSGEKEEGAGIGKIPEKANTLQVGWDSEFEKEIYYKGKTLLNFFYPVGSVYIAYNHTDPATLFGGTWVRMQDGFLWGSRATDIIGQTGGEKTHTLTVDELPSHNHGGTYTNAGESRTHAWLASGGSSMGFDTVSTGGGAAHNNMPPYIQVSIWRRTA